MRLTLFPAVCVTIFVGAISPALAQDEDCGLVCQLTGYLSTDHMAAQPSDAGPAAAAKGHRAHVAHKAKAKPQASPAPKLAANPETPVAAAAAPMKPPAVKPIATRIVAMKATTAKAAIAKIPAKIPAEVASRVAPAPKHAERPKASAPVETKTAAAATPRPAERPRAPTPRPTGPVPDAVAQATRSVAARHGPDRQMASATRPAGRASQAMTAAALIPGAAPAMPVGFQPFATPLH